MATIILATPAQPAGQMRRRIQIEADVFSGRPNPVWELSEDDAAAFLSRVEALGRLPADMPSATPEPLGYRGLIATDRHETMRRYRIARGVIVVEREPNGATVRLSDPGRAVEIFLIRTGRSVLGDELLSYLLSDAAGRN